MWSVMPVCTSHQSQCGLYQTENQIARKYDGIYINLEMYQVTAVCSVKHFTCHRFRFMEGELHVKSILCDSQLLTMHMLSAKGPTRNCHSSVHFGWASFAVRSENYRKCTSILLLPWSYINLWLLQRVAEMVRNLIMAYFVLKLVGNISYGRCGVIQDFCHGSGM